jgi:hypothetical protein
MNLEILIKAADFIDRQPYRESEHGYASQPKVFHSTPRHYRGSKKHRIMRSSHNQLEKKRRANLRQCLASLRELLPRNVSSERFTTLLLLKKAIIFIKQQEGAIEQRVAHKQRLFREQQLLRRRLDSLVRTQYRVQRSVSESSTSDFLSRSERTFSECSVGASSTGGGSTGSIDSEEVDILDESDSDDGVSSLPMTVLQ